MTTVDHYAQGTPSYVELTSPDQQAAKGFYGPLLGWEFEDVDMGEAGVYVAVSVQGDSIAGIAGQMPQLAGHPAFWGVYLAVDDVDATAAKVVPAGGKVEAGPFDVMELGRMASIQDPTGVRVNLWQAGQSIGSVRVNEPGCPIWHELSSPDLPGGHEVLQRRARRRVGVDADGDRRRLHLPDGRRPAGRRRLPAADGRHPAALGRLLQRRGLRRDRRQGVELGARELVAPYDLPGVGRTAMVRDPQGALVGFLQNPPDDG